jgi:FAD-dependent oxidoreductase family protein
LSAAIESARLHRDVVLVDSLPVIGGQMVHSLIGLFCGVFGNGPDYVQLTHGIFDDIFRDLGPSGDLHFQRGHTQTVFYNEVALGRWLERTVRSLNIKAVLGTVLQRVDITDGRINAIDLASRYGQVRIRADGFVDASGDAVLTWQAGLPCWVPERTIYGSQQVIVENVDENYQPVPGEIEAVLAARGEEHGLLRRGGLAFFFPGRGTAVLNVTHIEAPLDPVTASQAQFDGRDQADRAIALLKAEFPLAFGQARVRAYGFPGRRQTRWIKGRHQLATDEVRAGIRFADAVARTAWPIELHDRSDGYVWEMFGPGHVHYVPLRALTPPGAHNLVAAGRCADGDAAALSSVRVMGPCAAMGAGAAHALDLAARTQASVHDVDVGQLHQRLAANLGPPPRS